MSLLSTTSFQRRGKQPQHTLTGRTLLTVDGRAVPAGDPDGVVLLGPAGAQIPHSQAVALGLVVVPDTSDYPRHVGGGVYELSDGSRVKGKADARAAQKLLHDDTDDKQLADEDSDDKQLADEDSDDKGGS